ncbi:MAG: stage III sporulation protein AF [Clostridia bacterium]|nr:stage III sporulation protein AF [Clostridia bacterium]
MKNYLLTIILVSICIGIADIISPLANGISKYTKTIGILIILCVIISPISKVIQSIDESFFDKIHGNLTIDEEDSKNKYDDILQNYLNEFSISELNTQIKNILNQEFTIPKEECDIIIFSEQTGENLCISKIQILLSGKSIFKNPYEIENYFSKLLKCDCIVLIK